MNNKNDGGPAFPAPIAPGADWLCGASLRDYFASHAPPPPKWWMDDWAKNANDLDAVARVMSQWAFAYADAMLAERDK